MRLAVRRAVGTAGATAVAIGAALTLALPASAHDHQLDASCVGSDAVLTVTLSNYTGSPNSLKVTDEADNKTTVLLDEANFGHSLVKKFTDANASTQHTFTVSVVSGDGIGSFTKTASAGPCCPGKGTTTTTPPPSDSNSPTPTPTPTGSHSPTPTPTPSGTSTTPSVAVAATSTTPVGGGTLPFTGANVGLPLGIAGALVVIGGGLLFWLRFSARRRNAS